MARRRPREKSSRDHPEPMMRFRPDEWPGSPSEAYLSWRGSFDAYWQAQKAAGRVVLPEAVHACFVDKHLGWRFKAKSEGRRLVNGAATPVTPHKPS